MSELLKDAKRHYEQLAPHAKDRQTSQLFKQLIDALDNQWQPIETAPIDTQIIMRNADNQKEMGYMYETDNGIRWCSHGCFEPTHWHPVPE